MSPRQIHSGIVEVTSLCRGDLVRYIAQGGGEKIAVFNRYRPAINSMPKLGGAVEVAIRCRDGGIIIDFPVKGDGRLEVEFDENRVWTRILLKDTDKGYKEPNKLINRVRLK